jgi:hypothetical protein
MPIYVVTTIDKEMGDHMRLVRVLLWIQVLGGIQMGCGTTVSRSNEKIVGGKSAKAGDRVARHTMSIVMKKAGSFEGGSFCTGTLINKQWVVTAGHCVNDFLVSPTAPPPVTFIKDEWNPKAWDILQRDPSCKDKIREAWTKEPPKEIYLAFGGTVQVAGSSPGYDSPGTKSRLSEKLTYIPIATNRKNIFVHPQYNPNPFAGPEDIQRNVDLALIRVERMDLFPAYVQSAELISASQYQTVKQKRSLSIAGYGSAGSVSRIWDEVNNCEQIINMGLEFRHREIGTLRTRGTQYVRDYGNLFLTSGGGCKGDSGGPAFVEIDGRLVLVGALSADHMDGTEGGPRPRSNPQGYTDQTFCNGQNEYVNLAKFEGWIRQTMAR